MIVFDGDKILRKVTCNSVQCQNVGSSKEDLTKFGKPLRQHMKRVHLTRAMARGAAKASQSLHKVTL